MTALDTAISLAHAGISVIPIVAGSKKPSVEWKPFQTHIPTDSELVRMFADGDGIAAVCGPISGGLELMDFDVPGKTPGKKGTAPAWSPFRELLEEHGHGDLLRRLILVYTPSGGRHLVYRCAGVVAGNTKIAARRDGVLIETRGEGGYFLIPPTEGYSLKNGSFAAIPEVTAAEREILHTCARMLNEQWDTVRYERNIPTVQRPGDAFNLKGPDISEILVRNGWQPVRSRGNWQNYTRPGKTDGSIGGGVSQETGMFHPFSTSTNLEAGRGYSKFAVYAILEHAGDWMRAADILREQGYGEKRKMTPPAGRIKQYGPDYATCEPLTEDDEAELWGTLDEFEALAVEWFWKDRIPLGALSMLQGDPGLGKSFITAAVAATATIGGAFPCGQRCEKSHVVFVSTEDDPRKVLRPRFEMMGADLRQLSILATDKKREDGTPILGELPITIDMIFRRVEKIGAKLLVLDPLIETMAALGIDVNKSNEVRPVLAKMRDMAARLNCAVLIVHHQNKMSGAKSLYRSVGSIDIPAAMRSVFAVGVDPDDPERKALAHVKANWSALQPTLGYKIDFGEFGWTGESEMTADDMSQPMKSREDRQKSARAKEFLQDILRDGAVNAAIIQSKASDAGFGRRVMDAAKDAIGVYSWKVGGRNQEAYWLWSLKPKEEQPYDPMSDF